MAATARTQPIQIRTPEETAQILHPDMSPRTLERWRHNGTGPQFVRVGRRVGYTDEAITEWLARNTRTRTRTANDASNTRTRTRRLRKARRGD